MGVIFASLAIMALHAYVSNHPLGYIHDPRYLSNAIASHKWLKANGLFSSQGLHADDFTCEGGEECDCSESWDYDGQTFRGTYFWHLYGFCAPLPQSDDPKDGSERIQSWLRNEATKSLLGKAVADIRLGRRNLQRQIG